MHKPGKKCSRGEGKSKETILSDCENLNIWSKVFQKVATFFAF